ncbi:hypothetical protein Ddc_19594 [Ditylenchus destructor]|nr:hypothetical protein Ddc_19594 [Ditylenchus destructor]
MKSIIFAFIFALTLVHLSVQQRDRCERCLHYAEIYATSEGLPSGLFNIDDLCHEGHKWICADNLKGDDYETLREIIEPIKVDHLAVCIFLELCKHK